MIKGGEETDQREANARSTGKPQGETGAARHQTYQGNGGTNICIYVVRGEGASRKFKSKVEGRLKHPEKPEGEPKINGNPVEVKKRPTQAEKHYSADTKRKDYYPCPAKSRRLEREETWADQLGKLLATSEKSMSSGEPEKRVGP